MAEKMLWIDRDLAQLLHRADLVARLIFNPCLPSVVIAFLAEKLIDD